MLITVGTIISTHALQVESEGKLCRFLTQIDTETGVAKQYKTENDKLVYVGGEPVIEDIVLPIDKLHIYLVKPK